MQTIFKVFLALGVMLGVSSFTFKSKQPLNEVTLKVNVTSVKSSNGNVHILLFNQATGYPTNDAKAYKHVKSKAISGGVTFTLEKIPAGVYSVVAFHDANSNDKFDKAWYGSPKEDYGFSNIPGEFCGTPSFQQTSFMVSATQTSVSVKLMNVD